jgi:alpha-L-rhamnosidase
MGLLEAKDWEAEWIGFPAGWNGRALYFRFDFELNKEVGSARAYVAGLGYHELHLNGAKVGDRALDPGFTDYAKRVLYATHDVTAGLRRGKNTIGAIVGNGWYGMPKLLLQLEVAYADGTRATVSTHGARGDSTTRWRVTSGPILANSVFDGETYDARLEKPDWDLPGGDPRQTSLDRLALWTNNMPVEAPGGRLVSQYSEPIKIVDTLAPVGVAEPKAGVFVFDAGQNLAGWAELRVAGPRGTVVTLRFAESLFPDGTVNQESLRTAAATDTYILKGEGQETWQPTFTYHGFRYVQMEGFPGRPTLDRLTIKRIRSAVAPNGTFECGTELVNRIQRLVWNTEASNLHSVPTDCPQRNERMGWMNDLTVRLEESLYNFDLARFYTKFLADVSDTQAADGSITDTAPFKWGKRPADPVSASYLLMGWFLYQYYGDTAALAGHYDGFKAWVDFVAGRAVDHIVPYGSWGDWSPPAAQSVAGSAGSSAIAKDTPLPFMSTGYLYYCSGILAKMANVLGKAEDERRYADLARKVGDAFNRKYWNEAVGGYGSNNQACNSFALFLGVVPANNVPRVVDNLADDVDRHQGHLTTGNLCTKYLLETLTDYGRANVAFRIVTQESYPSWGFMLANGATTLWERWEHLTEGGMNSHNHPMMGSVSSWFYKYLAGIQVDPAAPGFKRIIIRPQVVDGLSWVRSSYASMYGVIRSEWRKEKNAFVLKVSVPVNTSAIVYIPEAQGAGITEGGQPVTVARMEGGARIVELGSGDFELVAR